LRIGQASLAQMLLQFIVCLGNCGVIALHDVVETLQQVQALSEGLRPAKGGDLGVFLSLAVLPYLSPAAYAQVTEKIDGVIARAAPYLADRDARWKPLLRVIKSEELPDRLEALDFVWKSLKASSWSAQAVMHVPGVEPIVEATDSMPRLPSLNIAAEDIRKSKVRLQVPVVSSRILTKTSENGQGSGDAIPCHDRWLLESLILSIMEHFGEDIEECSKQILRIPVLHEQFEPVVVETIFSQMLRLPTPPLLPLFYSRVLMSLVEKQVTIKDHVDKAFHTLAQNAQDLDEECLEVLAEAFAYHLMHNGYKAEWSVFTGDNMAVQGQRFIRQALDRLQRLSFHQNLLHRLPEAMHVYVPPEPLPAAGLVIQQKEEFKHMLSLVRLKDPNAQDALGYCQRLRHEEEDDSDAQKRKAVDEEDGAGGQVDEPDAKRQKTGNESLTSLKAEGNGGTKVEEASDHEGDGKITDEMVKQELNAASSSKNAAEGQATTAETAKTGDRPAEAWPLQDVVALLTMAMLQNGAKTPTHMSKVLDGYQEIISKLKPLDEEEAHEYMKDVVRPIFQFWRCSSQRLEITIDAMLNRGILTPRAVIEYALADRGPQGCDSMAVWNIVNNVASRSLEKSQSVRVELAVAKKLGKTEILATCRRQLDCAIQETAELFTLVFTGLVRNYMDFEEENALLRHVMLQRILTTGRKYHAFIKPLIDAAESRIPGVAHHPDIGAVFQTLSCL